MLDIIINCSDPASSTIQIVLNCPGSFVGSFVVFLFIKYNPYMLQTHIKLLFLLKTVTNVAIEMLRTKHL